MVRPVPSKILQRRLINLNMLGRSPGRFFANMELKAIFCYIVMMYDLKLKESIRPPSEELGIGVLPSRTAEIMIRRRKSGFGETTSL